jgi:hypothetical protein
MTVDQPALDQSKLAKSRLLVADAFTRDRAATSKPDPHDLASRLLEQLQALGWKQPPDPAADIPPLRPARVADGQQRAARKAEIDAALAEARERSTATRRTTLA